MSTYYLSKYALSDGIQALEGEANENGVKLAGMVSWYRFTLGKEVHETREAAVKAAEAMRIKKIVALRKQIERLEAMSFE